MIKLDKVQDLKKFSEGGVDARIGNERQSIIREELCVLAQDRAPGLQVLLERRPSLIQFSLVLDKDYAFTSNKFILDF